MSDSKPDEAFSDDFLFPMSSRLTFSTSGLESDGEFCGEDSPRKQNSNRSGNPQDSSSSLYRATSDPNLNMQRKDGTMTSEMGDNAQQYLSKASPDKTDRYGQVKEEKSKSGKLPTVPPKIDRQKKPSKKSAAERLFGQRAAQNTPTKEDKTNSPAKGGNTSATSSSSNTATNGPNLSQNNSNSNSYNPHAAENYDSYKHRGADMFPHYASRNPGGGITQQPEYSSPGQLNGSGTYGSLPNGMQPPVINGISPPGQNGMSPPGQNGGPPPAGMNGYAVTGQHSTQSQQEKYRYSEYKPMPPPKSTIYKPVPPPKPKPSSGPSGPTSAQRAPNQSNGQVTESNYMNGNYINPPNSNPNSAKGGPDEFQSPSNAAYQSEYNSYHYHSSKVVDNNQYTQPSPPRVPPYDNAVEVDSNGGVDSGQGSSLDRDYSSYNRYNGPPPPVNIANNGVRNPPSNEYYYNLPNGAPSGQNGTRNNTGPPAVANNGGGSRRRAPGDTLDLSNREHRGSAFELYKKPGGFKPYPTYGEVQR